MRLSERELHVAMRELQEVSDRLAREARRTDCDMCKLRYNARRQDVQGILAKLDKVPAA